MISTNLISHYHQILLNFGLLIFFTTFANLDLKANLSNDRTGRLTYDLRIKINFTYLVFE
jgi:hypothetical protein